MAHKLILTAPIEGMAFLWNVTQTVGTQTTEANAPTDVRLAKLLVSMGLDDPGSAGSCWPSARVKPTINETMDQSLGFWIYFAQVEAKMPADGVISPSPKFPSIKYFIVRMNLAARSSNPAAWENLPAHPACGPMLATELLLPPR